jgi:hypothetical protein
MALTGCAAMAASAGLLTSADAQGYQQLAPAEFVRVRFFEEEQPNDLEHWLNRDKPPPRDWPSLSEDGQVVTTTANFNDVNYYQLLQPAEDTRTYCEVVSRGAWRRVEPFDPTASEIATEQVLGDEDIYYWNGLAQANHRGAFGLFACDPVLPGASWLVSILPARVFPGEKRNLLVTALAHIRLQIPPPAAADGASTARRP